MRIGLPNFQTAGSAIHSTLQAGDYLLVNRFGPLTAKRGEVIVFQLPGDPRRNCGKRVIVIPGDRIPIIEGDIWLNESPLSELYITAHDTTNVREMGRGEHFVLGDNRRASIDSRTWGPVLEENIIGEVWFVYWPAPPLGPAKQNRTVRAHRHFR